MLCLSLGLSSSAWAVGPNDGIFTCFVGYESLYVTLNSSGSQGYMAFLESEGDWSYGIGTWSGQQLTGKTGFNGSFSVEVNGTTVSGWVDVYENKRFYRQSVTCQRMV